MRQIRGRLLYKGIQGNWRDTIKTQKKQFLECFFIFLISLVISISIWTNFLVFPRIPQVVGYIAPIPVLILTIFLIEISGGFEVDGIYENGITNSMTTLTEKIGGKGFHPYSKITKVGYGNEYKRKGNSEFIVVYENNSRLPTVRSYTKTKYKNDFYEKLKTVLKQKCPNVPWTKIDLYKISYWRR